VRRVSTERQCARRNSSEVSAPTIGGRKKERERDERKTEKGWDRDIVGLEPKKIFLIL
jgi:hypothetical protein